MVTRKKGTGKSSKNGNEKLIAAIITVLLAIFGFAYNGVNSKSSKKRAKTTNSKKSTAARSTKNNSLNAKVVQNPTILKGYQAVKVSDGDTLNVQKVENGKFVGEIVKIRMFGIDAPEKTQDYGIESKQALEKLVNGKTLEIEEKNRDRYGRTVAVVYVNGKNVNEEMVKNGNAWWYQEYDKKDTKMQAYQENAKKNKLGLFGKRGYVEPWNYRKEKKAAATSKTKSK
ncbi:thermonuclease family protein [Leptotrichia buccalis]|jgi:nuclease (SNase domain protein)|uniref:Nuclease (SNase domain protein) n=1 Tax=Leptotrichia buccalis (strain ATCC 14201 / DSM 1135 / JCM 12969 / NCTC 10249 / C-1013-b) TaxID=523794 RepID=C7NB22_LEPBD|nr:thermonuclease family protein [Leptotrichia buccalis]ACV39353.1 nuclease (SNase domain protein) [Leptotrichia buccalis C-1013-b]